MGIACLNIVLVGCMRFHGLIIRHHPRVRLYSVHDFTPALGKCLFSKDCRISPISLHVPYSTFCMPHMTYRWEKDLRPLHKPCNKWSRICIFNGTVRAFFSCKSSTAEHSTGGTAPVLVMVAYSKLSHHATGMSSSSNRPAHSQASLLHYLCSRYWPGVTKCPTEGTNEGADIRVAHFLADFRDLQLGRGQQILAIFIRYSLKYSLKDTPISFLNTRLI